MKILVVESPAKAKTINKYLGKDYEVLASFGHIRDLPAKDGSVDPEDDFKMIWALDDRGGKRLNDIARAVKGAEKLILATDPDREGEAISWHVLEALNLKRALKGIPVERVTFNAITKDAVLTALRNPREIDQALVDAYLARRALDYLVGFNLSPVLWRKLPGARSAGRVQSVALAARLRPRTRDRDVPSRRNTGRSSQRSPPRTAASSTPVSSAQTAGRSPASTSARARRPRLSSAIWNSPPSRCRTSRRSPPSAIPTRPSPPRHCSRKPRASSALRRPRPCGSRSGSTRVSRSAARRSASSPICGPTASTSIRRRCRRSAASSARNTATLTCRACRANTPCKAKNAQEAHEAIRPTDISRLPKQVAKYLEPEQARLYELIWTRTIASQMESAELERTTVDILAEVGPRKLDLRATGQVVKFDGFLTLYNEGKDDEADEDEGRLPPMSKGDALDAPPHRLDPALHRAAAALLRGEPRQAHGGARHRPAVHLCRRAAGAARPRICPDRQEAPGARGQGAPRHRVPGELLPPLRGIRLHRGPRRAARPHLQPRDRLEAGPARISGAISRQPSARRRTCARRRCSMR